ncbi:hypothetical protein HD596_010086 [Nonomuraea jabiensis]|uniref:Uncharacterized protein n=1 Tax=Nonomuraea jabiensis TaxID=882448 RepID=A0A7W9GGE5_9ACTN|nr:hypothetical protein [Nonomuraea jabiensis]
MNELPGVGVIVLIADEMASLEDWRAEATSGELN